MTAAGLEAAAFSSPKHKRPDRRSEAPLPVTTCTTQPGGMVGWWPGNGNANDIINGNNGTLVNGVTYGSGMVGQAFSFTQANQQYVEVSLLASQLLNNSAGSVIAWVNPSSVGELDMVTAFGSGADGQAVGFAINNGNVRIYHHTDLFDWQTSIPVAINTWTHLAYTWDGTTERLYKNGVLVDSRARNFNYVPGYARIGFGFINDAAVFFPGQIDEVAIFDRTLNDVEITAIYSAGPAGVCPNCAPRPSGMISMWSAENNALDELGNHNGTLVNGTTFATGKVGNAFKFDGIDDLVNAGNIDLASRSFSWDAWVKRSSSGTPDVMIGQGTANIGQGLHIGWRGGSNEFTFDFFNSTLNVADVPDGNWHHWAGSYDVTTGEKRIYKDGQLAGSNTGSGYSGTGPLWIGRLPWENPDWTGGAPLDGLMDEVEIFGRVVTQAEFRAIFQAGSSGRCDTCSPAPVGLVSWLAGDGNANDIRGFNNGIAEGSLAFASAKVSQGFNFDGNAADIRIPASTSLDVGVGGGITIDMWIKPTTVTNNPLAEWGSGVTGAHFWLGGSEVPGNLYINLTDTGGNFHVLQSAGGVIAPNEWQHVSMTYDKTTGIATLYRNGSIVAGPTNLGSFTPRTNSDLYLGYRVSPTYRFGGLMDEVEIFDRALTAEEITRIVNAGSSGVCKPTATTPPAGVVGWWGGDGFVSDISGNANHAALLNGAGFAVGKVGQAFKLDGINDYVEVPHNANINFGATQPMSFDVWLYRTSSAGYQPVFAKRPDCVVQQHYFLHFYPAGGQFGFGATGAPANGVYTTPDKLPLNTWTHVSVSFDGTIATMYVNGLAVASHAMTLDPNTVPLSIGGEPTCNSYFGGLIDDLTFYDRAITQTEIQSIVNAGLAGKLKQVATSGSAPMIKGLNMGTANGVGTYSFAGDATIYFPAVTANGVTHEIPLDPAGLPRLPLRTVGLTYDIATSAQYTGTPTVCFNLPSFTSTEFATLHILHLENGGWVDRTYASSAYPSLCAVGLTSLSPFAIVTTAPTAAELSIAGRVVTNEGRGIRGAFVTVTGTGGEMRTVPTGNLGRYIVTGLTPGNTYIVTVRSRRFAFAQPTQVITLNDNVTDADFFGSAGTGREQ